MYASSKNTVATCTLKGGRPAKEMEWVTNVTTDPSLANVHQLQHRCNVYNTIISFVCSVCMYTIVAIYSHI